MKEATTIKKRLKSIEMATILELGIWPFPNKKASAKVFKLDCHLSII